MKAVMHQLHQRLFRIRPEDRLPHVVCHQRIYIVPTGRGWAFLLALLLMLVASINYALSLGYALCFLLTGLFAATLLHTYRNVAGLQVLCIEAGECFAGESLSFAVTLVNERPQTRHGLRLTAGDSNVSGTQLPAQDKVIIKLQRPTTRRGLQSLGRLTLQSDWPLGLWTCWSYLHVPVSGLVYPMPEAEPPALPSSAGETGEGKLTNALQGDVSGLRDYQPGDSIGSIAWKSAARGQGLHVRTFDTVSGSGQTHLSLQNTGCEHVEEQLSRLCAWTLLAENRQAPYSLELPARQLLAGHGREHHRQALRALALHGCETGRAA